MNFSGDLALNGVFKTVSEAAREEGLDAYVVGGFVRDLILKRPSKDIDFVCVGSGIQLAVPKFLKTVTGRFPSFTPTFSAN